jgi:hypothetical protein
VHYAARRILDRQEWALARELREPEREIEAKRLCVGYALPIKWVPRLLGTTCFVAMGFKPASGIELVQEVSRPEKA